MIYFTSTLTVALTLFLCHPSSCDRLFEWLLLCHDHPSIYLSICPSCDVNVIGTSDVDFEAETRKMAEQARQHEVGLL
jgi:hypothetical protein